MASSVMSVDNHDKESLLSGNTHNQSPGKSTQNVSAQRKHESGGVTFNPDQINKQISRDQRDMDDV